mgnify:CR=1 FL=1
MTEDIDLIHSPLTQTYSADGHSLRVLIYRLPDTQWSLEVVDEQGRDQFGGFGGGFAAQPHDAFGAGEQIDDAALLGQWREWDQQTFNKT